MNFHVITLFPEVIDAYASRSIIGRAVKKKLISVKAHQLRDYSKRKWKQVDDRPYGGGPGMVLDVDSMVRAIEKAKKQKKAKVIITSPSGKPLTNEYARTLAKKYKDVIIVAGHYEGIDARVGKIFKAEHISTGPYVLTGGEIPALAIIDATARQIKGVLGKFESLEEGRVSSSEVYTRPEIYTHKGKKYRVPKVLLSGHRANIEAWKQRNIDI